MLVVEDDAPIRTLLNVVLTRAGFEVDAVPSGRDALTLLSAVDYSAIAVDLFMHGMSGRDVLDAIAARQPAALRKTIVVSAAPETELEDIMARYRGVHVIRKPFELDGLVAAIRTAAELAGPCPRDFASEFCRRSVLLGASTGIVLAAPAPGAHALELVTSFGYPPGVIEEFLPIRAEKPFPICKAYRLDRDIWISSVKLAAPDYPVISGVWEAIGAQALATLPLRCAAGTIGAVGWAFRDPRPFEPHDREQFASIAWFVCESLPRTNGKSAVR